MLHSHWLHRWIAVVEELSKLEELCVPFSHNSTNLLWYQQSHKLHSWSLHKQWHIIKILLIQQWHALRLYLHSLIQLQCMILFIVCVLLKVASAPSRTLQWILNVIFVRINTFNLWPLQCPHIKHPLTLTVVELHHTPKGHNIYTHSNHNFVYNT